MALQTSGAISLNEIHIEAGGSSGTQVSMNDSDVRDLIGKSSATQMSFNEWYGASATQAFTTIKAGYVFQTFTGSRGSTQYGFNAGFNADNSAPSGSISYTDDLVVPTTSIIPPYNTIYITLGTLARASVDVVASGRHDLSIHITGTNSNSGWTNVTCSRISNSASTTFARTSMTYSYASGKRQYISAYIFDSTGDLTAGGSSSGKHCKFWGDDTPTYNSSGTDSSFTGKIEFSS